MMIKVPRPRGRPRKHPLLPMRVAIATSDGFEARGLARDATRAISDYALLDEFTRFLEKKLVVQNVELLRRILAEYFCHCETTLRQFIAQGATQIGVGPIANEDDQDRAEAQQLLSKPRSFPQSAMSASVFTFLATRLRTVRASLLVQFFGEFCQGKDAALQDFVANPEGFIALFPLPAPQAGVLLLTKVDGLPFTSEDPLPMPPPPSMGESSGVIVSTISTPKKKIKAVSKKREAMSSEQIDELLSVDLSDDDEQDMVDDMDLSDDGGSLLNPVFTRPDESLMNLRKKIIPFFEKIELEQPWLNVYNERLLLPFDEAAHPGLANRLRLFWSRFGYTAWERTFWRPLDVVANPQANLRRRSLQRTAAVAFERILFACYQELGNKFFYRLDRHRHPGWWYRSYCVDLLSYAAIEGFDKCVQYVETQQHERFPDCGLQLPLKSANAGIVREQCQARSVSSAMWVQSDRGQFKAMKENYREYLRRKELKKKAKKKARKEAALATRAEHAYESKTRRSPDVSSSEASARVAEQREAL